MEKAMNNAPFFIIGFPRSGTTLLATLLDRHSKIAVTPETLFFRDFPNRFSIGKKILTNELVDYAMSHKRFSDMGLSPQELKNAIGSTETTLKGFFDNSLLLYSNKVGKPVIGEKSPAHLLSLPIILEWYPDAKIICILRDGRDAVLSMMKVPWSHNNLARHCAEWVYRMELLKKYKNKYRENFFVVKYESVLEDPEKNLKQICNFIGEQYEETQLTHGQQSSVVPEWELEWKKNSLKSLDKNRIGSWKGSAKKEDIFLMNSIMGKTLNDLNYSDVELSSFDFSCYMNSLIYKPKAYSFQRSLRECMHKNYLVTYFQNSFEK